MSYSMFFGVGSTVFSLIEFLLDVKMLLPAYKKVA